MRFNIMSSVLPSAVACAAWQPFPQWSRQQLSSLKRNQTQKANSRLISPSNDSESDTMKHNPTTITEKIRCESLMEMEKVHELFRSKPSSTRLIDRSDELASYFASNNIKNYLFDCDGVLYRGADPMPGAARTIESLVKSGKRVFFVTNNAASSRIELKIKLEQLMRIPKDTIEEEMMIGSAYVAAQYLKSHFMGEHKSGHKKVHIIGTSGLCKEVQAAGFHVTGGSDPPGTPCGMSRSELAAYDFPEGSIDALVIGLDNDFNYRKLCVATVLLQRNPEALLVATNRDAFDLVGSDGRHLPGNGALVSSIEAATERKAINVGKPSQVLASWLLGKFNLKADETIMIGDRLDTDVNFGVRSGMCSALVLTGCASINDLKQLLIKNESNLNKDESQNMMPTLVFPHVGLMVQD